MKLNFDEIADELKVFEADKPTIERKAQAVLEEPKGSCSQFQKMIPRTREYAQMVSSLRQVKSLSDKSTKVTEELRAMLQEL